MFNKKSLTGNSLIKNGQLFVQIQILVVAGCLFLLFQFIKQASSPRPNLVTVSETKKGLPLYISIPSIGVDAQIEKMGIEKDGSLEAPTSPENAGWYTGGPRPGEIGSAVIDGHFGWIQGLPAVFDRLSQVKKGDLINIKNTNGEIVTFIIREVVSYDWNEDFSNVFVSKDGKAHLNLITCGGTWDTKTQNYAKRIVVFADLVV